MSTFAPAVALARRPALALLLAPLFAAACSVKPTPLSESEVADFVGKTLPAVTANNEPLTGKIDLHEALARALKFNLDHRVELMATALAMRELDMANLEMLPRLVAGSVFSNRDNTLASSSRSILTGRQSLEPSTSSDRAQLVGELTFGWNILDFGLSYVRAKQQADKALIGEEQRRKAAHRILEDTRTAFWRAAGADRMARETKALEAKVRKALDNARALAKAGKAQPLPALTYERELILVQRELKELERNLSVARAQLAALTNIPPGTPFELAVPATLPVPKIPSGRPDDLIRAALENRAEVRQVMYEMRINRAEADAALLGLLPGINLYAGINADSNSYLYRGDWIAWGAKATWNAMSLVNYPTKKATISAKDDTLRERSLAIAMAVMTQVHVSHARIVAYTESYRVAAALLAVQDKILRQIQAETATQATGNQTLIREQMNVLTARAHHDIAYADLQNAHANLLAAQGIDPIPTAIRLDRPVAEIARELRAILTAKGL